MKKTKIVATIGPASDSREILADLINSGMNVARLNFSHGTNDTKKENIDTIRRLSDDLSVPIAIIADLSGPKMRLGKLDGIKKIEKGDEIDLSIDPKGDQLPMGYDISSDVKRGERIFLNDGLVELIVNDVQGKTVKTTAENSGWVSSNKGVNIPDTVLSNVFTKKDQEDALFALKEGIDFLALSFIQNANDVEAVRAFIRDHNSQVKIISKIETKEAINNIDDIVKFSDAVMVARGDLAIQTKAEEVPILQQKIVRLCRNYHRPVIIATQMLESMVENPRPTRAEVSDVANAVLDQVDAVMLSAESATGKYPVEAVKIMNNVITSVEENPDYKHFINISWEKFSVSELSYNAIAEATVGLAERLNSPLIVAATSTGKTVKMISSFRPQSYILAMTYDNIIRNQLVLVWGISPVCVMPLKDSDLFWEEVLKAVKTMNLAKPGNEVVLVRGTTIGKSGATDTIKVITF